MARAGRSRLCALAALGALVACWPRSPLCAVLSHLDAEIEGGGAVRTAREVKALSTTLRFLKQHSGHHMYGSQYDTNAIGESWDQSAMGHWVDRAGADSTAERLEQELMAVKIGGRTDSQRQAMRLKRMARQRELLSRVSRPVNAMLHWTDRPSAIKSAETLEEELMSTKIGGRMGNEGKRMAMHKMRVARQEDLETLAVRRPAFRARSAPSEQPARSVAEKPARGMLASSHYDANAVGERFQGRSAGNVPTSDAEHLERNLVAFKVGGQGGKEGRREEMRKRRSQRSQ